MLDAMPRLPLLRFSLPAAFVSCDATCHYADAADCLCSPMLAPCYAAEALKRRHADADFVIIRCFSIRRR